MSDSSKTPHLASRSVNSTSATPEEVADSLLEANGDLKVPDTLLDSPAEKVRILKDDLYYLDFVEFLVENCLFQVPSFQFTKHTNASYFWESLEPVIYHGNAIKLEGVQQVDFRALVKILYPLHYYRDVTWEVPPEPTPEEWKSILKLSFKWQMYDLFERAVNALAKALPLCEQVVLARTCGVYDWLKFTYTKLIQRATPISEDEARSIGLDAALKVIRVQEQKSWSGYNIQQPDADVTLRGRFDGPIACELEDLQSMNDAGIIPGAVERVMLGRAYGVRRWVQDGYRELSERSEPITLDEGTVLGFESVMSLCAARSRVLRPNGHTGIFTNVEKEVTHLFWEELNRLVEINERYGVPLAEPISSTTNPDAFGGGDPTRDGSGPATVFGVTASEEPTPPITMSSSNPPYAVHTEEEFGDMCYFQPISCMPEYENTSHEEIRVQDYEQRHQTASPFQLRAFSTAKPVNTGVFGAQPTHQHDPQPFTFGDTRSITAFRFRHRKD